MILLPPKENSFPEPCHGDDDDRSYHHCEKIEDGERAPLRNALFPIANSSCNNDNDNTKVLIRDSNTSTSSSSHLYPIHPPTSIELYLFPLDALHGPLWLKYFTITKYFMDPCPLHHKLIKYFKWDFTQGAGKGLCIKCKQNYRSSPSSICLQVRRASNLDSIKKDELTQYIDTRGIFTFIINGEDIHYLRPAYPIKEQKGARAYCLACKRALKEKRKDEVVCSIQCKLFALKHAHPSLEA